ncbi:MAG TPA: ankyrin repeat domain-containing protein [Dehalococcoidia bacterium]|nr:ankyrin repeat domain-containing protein [Dehalococcoidia bacterium]
MAQATELFAAIEAGDAATVRGLLAAEPALAGACNAGGLPAVLFALYRMQGESVEALLAARPSLDPFAAAALGREARVAELLKADPARASAFSADGFSALHLAAFFGHAAAARVLLDAGAAVNAVARNPMQVQPLHSAVAGLHHAVCALLLERGAEVNARQQAGWTPLHAAAQHGDRALVRALLAAGADPSQANDAGETAATIAARSDHGELAVLFREHGHARRAPAP